MIPQPKARRIDLFPDEFIGGVAGKLEPDELGLYWIICLQVYSKGGSIDDDAGWLSRMFKSVKPREIEKLLVSLEKKEKIDRKNGQIFQKRCEIELEKTRNRIKKNQENGKGGGRPTKENNDLEKANGSDDQNLTRVATTNHQPINRATIEGSGGSARDTDRHAIATTIAERFEKLRLELWPNESGLPAPRLSLVGQALSFLDLGGTVPIADTAEVVTVTMDRGMRHAQETGMRPTVSLLAFKNSIPNAIASHRAGLTAISEGKPHAAKPSGRAGKPTFDEQLRANREGLYAALAPELEVGG